MSPLLHLLPLLCIVLQTLIVSGEVGITDENTFTEYAKIAQNTLEEANDRLKDVHKNTNKALYNHLLNYHLPFGFDDSDHFNEKLRYLVQEGYIIRYSIKRKTPLFTAQRLDGSALKILYDKNAQPIRANNANFRPDPRLDPRKAANNGHYTNSGFTRGHHAPSGDMLTDQQQKNTFIMSNMAPQYAEHNNEFWLAWENYAKAKSIAKAKQKKTPMIVITGTIKGSQRISGNIVVPAKWYKLLVWCEDGAAQAEYIFTNHTDHPTDSTTEKWLSTDKTSMHNDNQPILKKLKDLSKVVYKDTNIDFKVSSGLCSGGVMVVKRLNELKKYLAAVPTQKKKGKKMKGKKRKGKGRRNLDQEALTSGAVCDKINEKILWAESMHKVSIKSGKAGKSILDVSKGSFSAGCRKSSDQVYTNVYTDEENMYTDEEMYTDEDMYTDNEDMTNNSLDANNNISDYITTIHEPSTLTATVLRGKSLRLLDFISVPPKIDLSAINLKLQKIVSSCSNGYVDIHSARSHKYNIIPGLLTVSDSMLSLRINYKDKNVIAVTTGKWAIGSVFVDFLARLDTKEPMLLLKGTPKKGLTINLKNLLNSLTGTSVPIPLPSVSLTNIAVTGQIDLMKGGLATIVVSGSIGRNRVHAVFQKPLKYGKFIGAFATDIGPIKLSYLIRKTVQLDISRVPFFGSLTIPRLGVTVSSEYITSSLLPKIFCKDGLLQKTAVTIPKGLQAFTVLNLRGTEVPLKIFYYKGSFLFEVINNGRLPIGTLLSTIPGVKIRSLPLPPGIRDIFHFQIDHFSFNTNSKEMVVDTQFPGTLRYFNGYLTITKPKLKVFAVLKHPRKVSFEVDGGIKIGKGDYIITIKRDTSTNKYVLKASFKTIPISDLIHKFSAKVLPKAFQRTLRKYIQFSIHNAKLAFPLGTRNLQIHLSGTPIIAGYKAVHMSAVIIRQGGKTKFIEGFQFGKVSLTTLIYRITGKNLRHIAILNQHLETNFIISPIALPGVHLYGSKLKDIKIEKGVSINAEFHWPSNCMRNKFCAVARRVIGKDAKLSLQASIKSSKSFILAAVLSNVKLGAGVVLQEAALQIKAGDKSSVGIEGIIHLKRVGITLSAGIRSGSRGVVLEGNMQGCWKRAFGAKWLTICNLHLFIAIQPTVTLVGALEVGGQVRIGNPSCTRHPLIALGYVGVDQLSPQNNFYYVQLKNKVTMETLFQAFCIKFRLPRPLADSGFPKGFLSSYSPAGKKLPKAHISIPAGFRLKGTINILGLIAHADVTVSLPKGIDMKIALSPLKIGGGFLQMYASRNDRSHGPFLKVKADIPSRKVDIHASGFVSVLGIKAEAMLRITNTKYEYMVRGKFLHLFQASLHITAHFGNIKQAGFRVRGYLKNDFFAVIRRKIQSGLQSSSRAATGAINNAKRKVNSKKVVFDRALNKLRGAEKRVNSAKGAFNRAANKLRHWRNKVHHLCGLRNCHRRVCIRCFKGKSCRKVWRGRFCTPRWGTCCRHITNPVCTAKNIACRAARKTAKLGLRGAKVLVQRSSGILNGVKAILRAAQHVVRVSKHSLDIANAFLEGVKRTYQAGTKALSAITKYGIGGVFELREVMFDVALSTAATAHFRVSVLVSVFRHMKRFSLSINLRNILSFVQAIGEQVIHGLKKFIR